MNEIITGNELVSAEEIEAGGLTVVEIRKHITEMDVLIDNELLRTETMIARFDNQINIVEQMNSKLFIDMNQCPASNYKKKSQLQRIYFSYLEIVNGLMASRQDYEKLRLAYIKEKRGTGNDLVKNLNSLTDTETNSKSVADTFRELNTLFQILPNTGNNATEPVKHKTRAERLLALANEELLEGGFIEIEPIKNKINGEQNV